MKFPNCYPSLLSKCSLPDFSKSSVFFRGLVLICKIRWSKETLAKSRHWHGIKHEILIDNHLETNYKM